MSALIGDPPRGPRDALLADITFAARDHLVLSIDQNAPSNSPRRRADLIP